MNLRDRKYIAWIAPIGSDSWDSVAIGPYDQVIHSAELTARGANWREFYPTGARIKITTYGKQQFVKAYEIKGESR